MSIVGFAVGAATIISAKIGLDLMRKVDSLKQEVKELKDKERLRGYELPIKNKCCKEE
jgi:hypothetical protein